MLEQIQSLYGYNTWANQCLFDTAAGLAPEQFLGQTHATLGNLRNVLAHIVGAQRLWIARAQGQPRPADVNPGQYVNVDELREAWVDVDASTHRFLDGLTEPDLNRTVRYVNDQGETWAYPLWQVLFHQVNHAMQHRSEAALVISAMGHSTGWMDYLVYIDQIAA